MEELVFGPINLSWDPATRIAFISFSRSTVAVGEYADPLIEAMNRWIGDDHQPFGLLGDGTNLAFPDAEYRNKWGSFFKQHSKEAYLAFFNMDDTVRMVAEFFGMMFGLKLKTFINPALARDWLSKKINKHPQA